jgi:hypothetical protein
MSFSNVLLTPSKVKELKKGNIGVIFFFVDQAK